MLNVSNVCIWQFFGSVVCGEILTSVEVRPYSVIPNTCQYASNNHFFGYIKVI